MKFRSNNIYIITVNERALLYSTTNNFKFALTISQSRLVNCLSHSYYYYFGLWSTRFWLFAYFDNEILPDWPNSSQLTCTIKIQWNNFKKKLKNQKLSAQNPQLLTSDILSFFSLVFCGNTENILSRHRKALFYNF